MGRAWGPIYNFLYLNFIIQRVKARPHQPSAWDDTTVSVAKPVLPQQVPIAAFATGQGVKTKRAKVPLCRLSS